MVEDSHPSFLQDSSFSISNSLISNSETAVLFSIIQRSPVVSFSNLVGNRFTSNCSKEETARKQEFTQVGGRAGESQGQGEPGGLPSMGSHRVGHD